MAKQRFEAELGLNIDSFLDGLKKGEFGMSKFGKNALALTAAFSAAAGALSVLAMWFKQTDQGAKVFNTTIKTTRQLLTDLIMGQRNNYGEIIKLYKKESEIKEGDRIDLIKESALRKEIRGSILGSVDANKSITQQLKEAEKALAKQRELEAYILADKKEELENITEQLKINQGNTKLMDRHAQLMAEINDTENSESRRLVTQINVLREEKLKRERDLVEAFTFDQFKELRTGLADITNLEKLLGVAYDDNAERLALYQQTLLSLIADGFDPASRAIQDIIKKIDELNNRVTGISKIKIEVGSFAELASRQNFTAVSGVSQILGDKSVYNAKLAPFSETNLKRLKEANKEITKEYWLQDEAVNALSDSLYEMFKGTEDWGKNMVNTLIEALTRFITKAIAAMAIQGVINLISNLRQGYGFSFSSLGSGTSVLGSIGLASGGLAYGPTLAMVGEYGGASSNPEVIAPLNKLMQYMGGGNNINVTVEGRIRGRDLDLVQRRYGVGG